MTQIPKIVQGISSQARLEAAVEIARNIGGAVPPPEATASASPASSTSLQPVVPPAAQDFPRSNPAGLPSLAGLSPPAASATRFQTLPEPQVASFAAPVGAEQAQVFKASGQARPASDALAAQLNAAPPAASPPVAGLAPAAAAMPQKPPDETAYPTAKPVGGPEIGVKGLSVPDIVSPAAGFAAAYLRAMTPSAAASDKTQALLLAENPPAEPKGAALGASAMPQPRGLATNAAQTVLPAHVPETAGSYIAPGNLMPNPAAPGTRGIGVAASQDAALHPASEMQPGNTQTGADAVNTSAASRALAHVIAQLGNPALLDWASRPGQPTVPASTLAGTGTEATPAGLENPLRKGEGVAAGSGASASIAVPKSEKGLDDGYGKPTLGQILSAGTGRETAALQNVKYGLGADIGVSREPAATGLAPSSLFGGEASPALNGSSIPGVVLNAAMIPGWPQQRPYANSPGEGHSKAGQTTGPAMTDEEILAYLVNFGADEKMLARAKKMLATPVAGKKLMTFLAVMMTAMSTVLRTVKDELEAMLAEQEEEKQHESAHHSLAGQRPAKRARLFLK